MSREEKMVRHHLVLSLKHFYKLHSNFDISSFSSHYCWRTTYIFFSESIFLNCEIFIGFWCHEDSPLIHPVGWAQQTNHHLDADPEYISRCRAGVFLDNDAVPELFAQPKLSFLHEDVKIVTGMKLEAIDPLNLSAICVATVMSVSILNYYYV
jgi:hypothetical protein